MIYLRNNPLFVKNGMKIGFYQLFKYKMIINLIKKIIPKKKFTTFLKF